MPEPLILIPGDEDQNRGYRITKWKKYNNYECIYCQYSTLWLDKMQKHQSEGNHPWAYPGQNEKDLEQQIDLIEPEY